MNKIILKGNFSTKEIWLNGNKLSPLPSLKIRNHSPDGFNWGYSGSGPAQLALAILLSLKGSEIAQEHYHDFKSKVISQLPQEDFEVTIDAESFEIFKS